MPYIRRSQRGMIGICPAQETIHEQIQNHGERKADYTLQIHDSQDSRFHKVEMLSCPTMAKDAKKRVVIRNYIVPLYQADLLHPGGIVDKDGNVEPTGHKQVSIRYDQTLFEVKDKAGELLEEISVDEGMVDLLKAVWRHGIPTAYSCQGRYDETAWIRFVSFEDACYFLDLVSHPDMKWDLNKIRELSFLQEDIVKITEKLNSQAIGGRNDVTKFFDRCSSLISIKKL